MATDGAEDSVLLELLEFVDSWKPDAVSIPTSTSSAALGIASGSVFSGRCERRRRNPEVDARRRLKKKKERQELKSSVEELTERLKQLQRSQTTKAAVPRTPSWTKAELDNMALRSRLATNAAIICALQDALSPELVNVELDAALVAHAIAQQRATLREMLANNDAVFESIPPLLDSPFLLRSEFKLGANGSPRVELSSAVELDGNLAQVIKFLRCGMKTTPPFWGTVCNCIETEGEMAEGAYALGDRVLDFQQSNLRSVGLVQKHQQADNCMNIMWSSQVFHVTAGVSIVSRTRLRITTISGSRSLMQGFTELLPHDLPDNSIAPTATPSQAKAVRNVLVRAFGERLAAKQKVMLRLFLQTTGRDEVASLVA